MSKKSILVALISLSMLTASESKAAFPVKKAIPVEIVSQPASTNESSVITWSNDEVVTTTETSKITAKKHSWFSRVAHKIAGKAAISQAAYIILSIFWLGWLAIGLNDDFEGTSWLIALLLYILFYLPGLIYSLIVMGDYY
ncbi:MAG: hypothetical protein JWQ38_1517 [Flavipsychrobacter sp.]|nr:hypothetical protein [Flavipsychrobacter sp.]